MGRVYRVSLARARGAGKGELEGLRRREREDWQQKGRPRANEAGLCGYCGYG